MCFGGPPTSAAPPPPQRPPPVPTEADPAVKRAKVSSRRKAALAKGRQSTLIGGQLRSEPANQPRKSLLGA